MAQTDAIMAEDDDSTPLTFMPDKDQLGNLYRNLKEMAMGLSTDTDWTIDANCYTILSYLIQYMSKDRTRTITGTYKLWKIEITPSTATTPANAVLKSYDWTPQTALVEEVVNSRLNAKCPRSVWFPFLSAIQMAMKTRDTLLYQRNEVSNELGCPASCEVFACGKNIKNKFKKSRPKMVGPLAHLYNLKQLREGTTWKKDGQRGKRNRMSNNVQNQIEQRYVNWIKSQSISKVQKAIIDDVAHGSWELVPTLCVSYLVIKPHIEHHFVLTPDLIMNTMEFKGANFSDEWVWKTAKEVIPKTKKLLPTEDKDKWNQRELWLTIFSIFQCWGEPLEILQKVFKRECEPRNSWGRYPNKAPKTLNTAVPLDYSAWCKPQRGAPRNMRGERDNQICSKPSFRGSRTSYNEYSTLEEAMRAIPVSGSQSLLEQLKDEYKKYAQLTIEGTGDWYEPGGNQVTNITDGVQGQTWFLSA